jgi:DNA-binding PadR family transcriptional regulator
MVPEPPLLGLCLLGLVHQAPRSGYELRKVFAGTAMGSYSDSPGAIYPALRRLHGLGLVSKRRGGSARRPTEVFRPTRAGVAALRRWLARPVAADDVRRREGELALRFAFMGDLLRRRDVVAHLRALKREILAVLVETRSWRDAHGGEMAIHARLALDLGIARYGAWARWVTAALAAFGGRR